MDRQEIARLICKTMGLWFGLIAILAILPAISSVEELRRMAGYVALSWPDIWICVQGVLPIASYVLVAAALWFAPDWFATRMVSDNPQPVTEVTISANDILSIALSVCGVFIFANSFNDLVYLFVRFSIFGLPDVSVSENPHFWKFLFKAALGIWLIVGSRGIVGIIQRFRNWRLDRQKVDMPSTNDS